MDGSGPVQLWLLDGVTRVQRWHHNSGNPHQQRWVTIGTVADGRWFAEIVGPERECRLYADEEQARQAADDLMADQAPWIERPAAYTAEQEPATPGPWIRVGAEWRRPG